MVRFTFIKNDFVYTVINNILDKSYMGYEIQRRFFNRYSTINSTIRQNGGRKFQVYRKYIMHDGKRCFVFDFYDTDKIKHMLKVYLNFTSEQVLVIILHYCKDYNAKVRRKEKIKLPKCIQ